MLIYICNKCDKQITSHEPMVVVSDKEHYHLECYNSRTVDDIAREIADYMDLSDLDERGVD